MAQLRQDPTHPLAILGRRRAVLGPLVGDLQELAAGGRDEPGVLLVQGHRFGLTLGRQEDVVARETDEVDLVLGQQRLQRLRLLAELRHDVGPELDAVEARLGDVGDARHIVVPPRHGVARKPEGTGGVCGCGRRRPGNR